MSMSCGPDTQPGSLLVSAGALTTVLHVLDLADARARVSSGRPVYGHDEDVLVVTQDPFAGTVTVRYVRGTQWRTHRTVPQSTFSVRTRPTTRAPEDSATLSREVGSGPAANVSARPAAAKNAAMRNLVAVR